MVSSDNGVNERIDDTVSPTSKGQSPLHTSISDLPHNEIPKVKKKNWTIGSPTSQFWRIAQQRDEVSRMTAASVSGHHLRERLRGIFSRKIDWDSVKQECKEWFRDPVNIALFIWITVVAISGAILFLVMTGMLNQAIPKKSQRNAWFEVNNQILNALFTLMCLYQHPKRIHHLVMLIRWKREDISKLRKIYCKNGTYKPHEWAHMMVVVALLHLNCFAQYALCALNLGYRRAERPPIGVAVCISVAIAAPAIAGVYTIMSPLGKEYVHGDEESQVHMTAEEENVQQEQWKFKSYERRMSFVGKDDKEGIENNPTWTGGIFDFWDDLSVAYFSFFCSFCVFGWNMERLGFGNMYVHIATFILFCTAPYFIFNLAAVNVGSDTVRQALGFTGFILCGLGLFYGGYWRMRMRKRFKLPSYNFCFGRPAVADCVLWLCCCWCSLAQEVRTADSYGIEEVKLDKKQTDESKELETTTLQTRDGARVNGAETSSPMVASSPATASAVNSLDPTMTIYAQKQESSLERKENTMTPPAPLSINREDK